MKILPTKIVHIKTLGISVQKKTPFAKVTVHNVIDNLMENSDNDEEVFDHDDCEAIFYVNNEDSDTESEEEEEDEDDIYLYYICDIKLFFSI